MGSCEEMKGESWLDVNTIKSPAYGELVLHSEDINIEKDKIEVLDKENPEHIFEIGEHTSLETP